MPSGANATLHACTYVHMEGGMDGGMDGWIHR